MRKKSCYCLLLLIVLFASCEKEIQVKVPPFQAKLSVISMPVVGDSITLKLGKAISVSDHKTNPNLSVSNATIKLYADGAFKGDMTYDPDMEMYRSSVVAEAGRHYSLSIKAPSFPDASVDIIAPSIVAITNVAIKRNARIDAEKNSQDEVTITFSDPASASDYYMLRINEAVDTMGKYPGYGGFCVNTIDGSVETESNESIDITTCVQSGHIFMRDELFNGGQKQLKFYINSNFMMYREVFGDTLFPTVELHHVSEAYFKFEKSRIVASYSNGDPFSEPANVYTNVNNGYGIFSITAIDVKPIK